MSAVIQEARTVATGLPLLAGAGERNIAWHQGRPVSQTEFLHHVAAVAARLPANQAAVNLCEDRYHFLVAFAAVALAGQTNLLPPSRARQAVDEVMGAHPGCYAISDQQLESEPPQLWHLPALDSLGRPDGSAPIPSLPGEQIVAIGYTSGSTGAPKPNPKTWASFSASTALNVQLLQNYCGNAPISLVATVPPQHMYGMEMSVLLPLLGPIAVHTRKPLMPGDIAAALTALPAPRVLVTTPVHLRALVQAGATLPPLAAIVCATAPLCRELAATAQACFATEVVEVFGSTETCVIAHRRSADDESWQHYAGVTLRPQPDGTLVDAPWFPAPVTLHDIVELLPPHHFRLRGRNADLLEIAGKRASLADLNRRLLGIAGVVDGVIFQRDCDSGGVQRLAALVVAPGLSEGAILDALRAATDPAFLPRPLRKVDKLPRNETGKLPRAALLAAL
ncbi:AMP-binding enzyme [Tahibacter aquaticus]|uniref:AMP-binding enzyme n=1 Tax=Tahibacter aquaticus TaxID=520092 RepID=A0A4R6YVI4_9GAMM|nr:AMP-binding protein [Tahibacter aquaticus]TDR42514.1 AMP-binding enzyme [Tahibacter aquaticus]